MPVGTSTLEMPAADAGVAVERLDELGVAGIASAIRRGDVTAEAVAVTLIERARAQAALNAFISIDEPAVLEAARSADLARAAGRTLPLLGVPIGVKDSYLTRGLKTSLGTSLLKDFVPGEDAAVVGSLRAAGALVFGKNNLVEMSYGLTGANPHHGQARNPYNTDHVTGGSSSGSAASVAAQLVPASLGGDTVGSIRVPASLTGVVGFKPTPGRWSSEGVAPISHTLDTTGLISRSVADAILLDGVVTGAPAAPAKADLEGVRIAYAPRQHLVSIDDDVEANFRETLRTLADAGARLVEVDLGNDFMALTRRATWTIFARETRPAIVEFLQNQGIPASFEDILTDLGPEVRRGWEHLVLPTGAGYSSDATYNQALNRARPEIRRRLMQRVFDRADALVFPTTPTVAPAIDAQRKFMVGGKEVTDLSLADNTLSASLAGLPGVSLPGGLSAQGLPFAIEIDGAPGNDLKLLELARRVELVLGPIVPPPDR